MEVTFYLKIVCYGEKSEQNRCRSRSYIEMKTKIAPIEVTYLNKILP